MSNSPCGAEICRPNWRKFAARVAAVAAFALPLSAHTQTARAQAGGGSPNLVISQVYTRGGEAGASYQKDFIEIFNRGTESVDMNNYGLHISSINSTSSVFVRLVSSRGIVVQPGPLPPLRLEGRRHRRPAFLARLRPGQPSGAGALSHHVGTRRAGRARRLLSRVPGRAIDGRRGLRRLRRELCMLRGSPRPRARSRASDRGGDAPARGVCGQQQQRGRLQPSPANPRNSASPAGVCSSTTPPSFFNFATPQFDTHEAAGRAEIVVTRTGDLSAPATVGYSITGGTAFERADYTTAAGRLRFAPGESRKTFDILLTDDATQEQNETVELLIWKPSGGGAIGLRERAKLVIHDNDFGPAASNPIDSSAFFVRQHYTTSSTASPTLRGSPSGSTTSRRRRGRAVPGGQAHRHERGLLPLHRIPAHGLPRLQAL